MKDDAWIRSALAQTRVLRPPKHHLATFGTTEMHYVLLSAVPEPPDGCRLREGDVVAQRPQILTPDLWQKRFEGFGDDQDDFRRLLERQYGENLRALEYQFRNTLKRSTLEHTPMAALSERIAQELGRQDAVRTALLQGPDEAWGLSIMKFIVDMSLHSFPTNLRELDEHGFFDPHRDRRRQNQQIEALFNEARQNPSRISDLASTLKKLGRFEDYEDRFFALLPGRS